MALNVLDSIKDFYQIALKDLSRNGVTIRKIVLESTSGTKVKNSNQLSQLAEILGARRQTLVESSKMRNSEEENQRLKPLVERLGRKPPEGENVISLAWKIKAGRLFKQDNVSDIVKGHHCMYKV